LLERECDHEQASGPFGAWSVPSRPRRCGPVDRLTGHCPFGCGAVRAARSARYEAGCSLAAALAPTALARARTTGSLDRLPQMHVVAEPSAQLLLRLIPLQSAPLGVSGCLAAPNRWGAVPQQGRASQQRGPAPELSCSRLNGLASLRHAQTSTPALCNLVTRAPGSDPYTTVPILVPSNKEGCAGVSVSAG
jgi:hypothetical protein